jgi:hypothetical protein
MGYMGRSRKREIGLVWGVAGAGGEIDLERFEDRERSQESEGVVWPVVRFSGADHGEALQVGQRVAEKGEHLVGQERLVDGESTQRGGVGFDSGRPFREAGKRDGSGRSG